MPETVIVLFTVDVSSAERSILRGRSCRLAPRSSRPVGFRRCLRRERGWYAVPRRGPGCTRPGCRPSRCRLRDAGIECGGRGAGREVGVSGFKSTSATLLFSPVPLVRSERKSSTARADSPLSLMISEGLSMATVGASTSTATVMGADSVVFPGGVGGAHDEGVGALGEGDVTVPGRGPGKQAPGSAVYPILNRGKTAAAVSGSAGNGEILRGLPPGEIRVDDQRLRRRRVEADGPCRRRCYSGDVLGNEAEDVDIIRRTGAVEGVRPTVGLEAGPGAREVERAAPAVVES